MVMRKTSGFEVAFIARGETCACSAFPAARVVMKTTVMKKKGLFISGQRITRSWGQFALGYTKELLTPRLKVFKLGERRSRRILRKS
jgi:hypothetical protein